MEFRVRYAWVALLPLLAPSILGADQKVGDLAGPGHLTIQGAVTFPAQTIESQLRQDPIVQIAGQPASPLAAYLEVLQRQTLRGYQVRGVRRCESRCVHQRSSVDDRDDHPGG